MFLWPYHMDFLICQNTLHREEHLAIFNIYVENGNFKKVIQAK